MSDEIPSQTRDDSQSLTSQTDDISEVMIPEQPVAPVPNPPRRTGPFTGHTDAIMGVAYFPDGKRIASGAHDNTVRIWDAQTGGRIMELVGHTAGVNVVAISPDGKRIASGAHDHTVRVWDAQTGKLLLGPLEGHKDWVMSLQYSPDGKLLASGDRENKIHIWDSGTGGLTLVIPGHTDAVRTLSFSPDGKRLVSGANDNTIRMSDVATGELIFGPLRDHTNWIRSIAFAPDGKHFVSGSDDGDLIVWDAEFCQKVLGPLKGHTDWVGCVVYSPDGTKIMSGAHDKTFRIWDAFKGRLLMGPLSGHDETIRALAYSPDGTRILTSSTDCTLRIWDAKTGYALIPPIPDQPPPPIHREKAPVSKPQSASRPRREGSGDSFLDLPAAASDVDAVKETPETHPRASPSRNRPSFDSILDLPATLEPHYQAHRKERNFPSKKQSAPAPTAAQSMEKEADAKQQPQRRRFPRLWSRLSTRKPRTGSEGRSNSVQLHNIKPSRSSPVPVVDVPTARGRNRVFAAQEDQMDESTTPGRRLTYDEDIEYDDGSARSPGSEHSVHGWVDTLCFCLCFPCCR
ncbi:WD40 repeat-like protein [Leucogyrophana mollusca]|uniref:WD40 repeat-like protein n=1 Tax=Leucogyrophana mollusca TaxID=85980 RepID=A0ACB8BM43_9AGAM|nr:WD40 repeat-like protein [Leucogyrophana mollusca]